MADTPVSIILIAIHQHVKMISPNPRRKRGESDQEYATRKAKGVEANKSFPEGVVKVTTAKCLVDCDFEHSVIMNRLFDGSLDSEFSLAELWKSEISL